MSKKITKNIDSVSELINLIRILRRKCPWDRSQTLNTMKNNVIEEAYEVVDAIEKKNLNAIKEEIGDLLFLGFFLVQLLESVGIPLKKVVADTINKYKKKHPHVFESKRFKNTDEIVKFWHGSKEDIFRGIPLSLPALIAARLIQERAARIGFDWSDEKGPIDKLIEEIEELKKTDSKIKKREEVGDLLFSCVNLARHLKLDPEEALRQANKKFVNRFRLMMKRLKKKNKELSSLNLNEMDRVWEEVKARRKK